MIRNNLLALLIHTVIGALLFVVRSFFFKSAATWAAMLILGVFYLLYFDFSYRLARIHVFDTDKTKIYHVILPSIVMLAVIAALYFINTQSSSAVLNFIAGIFGQPVKFIMSFSGDRLKRGFSILGVILQCITPAPIIWFGLVTGAKKKAKNT